MGFLSGGRGSRTGRAQHWKGGSCGDKALPRPGWQSLEPLAESVLIGHEDAPDRPAGAQRPPELRRAGRPAFHLHQPDHRTPLNIYGNK